MRSERGFVDLVVAAIAFGVFVVVMAVGIEIDRLIHPPCKESKTQHCIDFGSGTVEAPKGPEKETP
jgi:hypothetical protein